MVENDTERVAHIKRLFTQIAGNVDSSRPAYALADQLMRTLQRDHVGLSAGEHELLTRWIRKITNT